MATFDDLLNQIEDPAMREKMAQAGRQAAKSYTDQWEVALEGLITSESFAKYEKRLGVIGATALLSPEMLAVLRSQLEEAVEMVEPIQDSFDGIQRTFGGNIYDSIENASNLSAKAMVDITDSALKIYGSRFGELTDVNEKYMMEIKGTNVNMLQRVYGSDTAAILENFDNLVNETFGSNSRKILSDFTEQSAIDLGLYQKGLGLSQQQLSGIVTRTIARTGKASNDMLEELSVYSKSMGDAVGVSAKEIADVAADIINSVETMGNITVKEATRMAAAVSQMGVEFSKVNQLVGKLQNFDTAADTVGNLTAVYGVQLDTLDLMTKAYEDPTQAIEDIRQSFFDAGIAIEDMGLAEKQFLASQLQGFGITDVEQFLDPDRLDIGLDALDDAADASDMSEEGRREAFNQMTADMERAKLTTEEMQKTLEATFSARQAKNIYAVAQSTQEINANLLSMPHAKDIEVDVKYSHMGKIYSDSDSLIVATGELAAKLGGQQAALDVTDDMFKAMLDNIPGVGEGAYQRLAPMWRSLGKDVGISGAESLLNSTSEGFEKVKELHIEGYNEMIPLLSGEGEVALINYVNEQTEFSEIVSKLNTTLSDYALALNNSKLEIPLSIRLDGKVLTETVVNTTLPNGDTVLTKNEADGYYT